MSSPEGALFAGTLYDGIFRSTDFGVTWTEVNGGLTDFAVNCLAVDSVGSIYSTVMTKSLAFTPLGYIFAATYRGIFRSTEGGTSWVCVALKDLICRAVAVNSLGDVFVASCTGHTVGYSKENGVWFSTDNGTTWIEANNDLLDSAVTCLTVDPSGFLYAGTRTMVERPVSGRNGSSGGLMVPGLAILG